MRDNKIHITGTVIAHGSFKIIFIGRRETDVLWGGNLDDRVIKKVSGNGAEIVVEEYTIGFTIFKKF